MANKNTKQFNAALARAVKRGENSIGRVVNSRAYHSDGKYQVVSVPVCRENKDGVVSANDRKNMQMRILRNPNDSRTVHEPIVKSRPFYAGRKGWVYPTA